MLDWLDRFAKARESPGEASIVAELESGLTLAGVTGVEDKLQPNVGETIESLRRAGIKVWMLTGDKLETAENIGLATSLITATGMHRVVIDWEVVQNVAIGQNRKSGEFSPGRSSPLKSDLPSDEFFEFLVKTRNDFTRIIVEGGAVAVLVDGIGLECILSNQHYRLLFAELTELCASVICCRTSPEQKGSVVGLIRKHAQKTCVAVGDGANDCNMLQRANIGIGIKGNEGMQAFNTCDYGIEEFQTLAPLLLVHGRWAYRRIAKSILYMYYKNIVICLPSYFINAVSALFSGQRLFEEYMYQLFNVAFTALPVIVFGIFEQDLTWKDCLAYPHLYRIGPARGHATKRAFAAWLLCGLWHSVCVFFIPFYSLASTMANEDGIPSDLFLLGAVVYLALMLVVNAKILLESYYVNYLFVGSIAVSVAAWFAAINLIEVIPLSNGTMLAPYLAGVPARMYESPMRFFIAFAAIVASLSRDFIFKAFRLKFSPRDYHSVMRKTNNAPENIVDAEK